MKAGDKVRLKSDPARIGVLSGETQLRAGKVRHEVRFFDGIDQFVLEGALELVTEVNTSPYAMFRDGRYGRVTDLRGALTYFRLSGKLANLIYSLNTTNTEFFSYQFKPVLNFLESPSRGILIADEVGLGKTIEAGLIWTELRSRFDARRLLVICPAVLREKWKLELQNRFGIEADICSATDLLDKIEQYQEGERDSFCAVASLQGMRPPSRWDDEDRPSESAAAKLARALSDAEHDVPIFDLVIIDEAHYLRNPETNTAKLGKLIRPVSDALVLLSATPIQTSSSDLYSLVRLLDEDNFAYEFFFQTALNASKPLVALRDDILAGRATRDSFVEALGWAAAYPALAHNQQISYYRENPPSDEELGSHGRRSELADVIDRINPLSRVISRTRKRDVHERKVTRVARAITVPMTEIEESFYFSVTAKIRQYCERSDSPEGFIVTIPQRQMTSSMAAACRAWRKKILPDAEDEFLSEAWGIDVEEDRHRQEVGPLIKELVRIADELGDYEILKQNDSKFQLLLASLREYWASNPAQKIVLFSFYRETLHYLQERLLEEGIASICLMGGMDKMAAIREFESPESPKILLASEVASEGVDLQFSSLLINYDLPWNPMKIEQRIGRIDRIGQRQPVIHIWNLFHEDTIDDRVYVRLLGRLNIFQSALGSMEGVLGEQIREMTKDLFSHNLSPEQEVKVIEQTYMAVANQKLQDERLEEESSHLIAHGDYIQNKVKAAQDLKRFVTAQDLYWYFRDFFDREYPGCRIVEVDNPMIFEVELTAAAKYDFSEFLQRERLQGKTRLVQPFGNVVPKYQFENKVALGRPAFEVISQYHPVIRFISERYKAKGKRTFQSVISARLSVSEVPGIAQGVYVFSIARWAMRVATRDVERLSYQALALESGVALSQEDSERLINSAALVESDWPAARNMVDGKLAEERFGECEDLLEERYQEFVGNLKRENADRIGLLVHNLESHLERENSKLQELIARMRRENKLRGVKLQEDKLKKLRRRIEDQLDYVRASETPTHESIVVTNGVILLD